MEEEKRYRIDRIDADGNWHPLIDRNTGKPLKFRNISLANTMTKKFKSIPTRIVDTSIGRRIQ